MPANWRDDCPHEREGADSAVSVTVKQPAIAHKTIVIFNEPGRRSRCRAGESAGKRFAEGARASGIRQWAALQITCVVRLSGKQSRRPASQRSEKRSVGWSLMPTPPQSQQHFAGSRFPAQSRQRQPSFLTPRRQSVGRGLRRDGNMGALGRPARSLPPWCQTNLVLPVSSAVSVRCNAACEMEAVQKWPISRLLPRPAPGGASRRYCCVLRQCEASRRYC